MLIFLLSANRPANNPGKNVEFFCCSPTVRLIMCDINVRFLRCQHTQIDASIFVLLLYEFPLFMSSGVNIFPGIFCIFYLPFLPYQIISRFAYCSILCIYLSIDYNTTDSGVVASMTNNGDSAADYVWMDVV